MAITKKFLFKLKSGDPVMIDAETRLSAIRELAKKIGFADLAQMARVHQTTSDALYDMVPTTIVEEFDVVGFKKKSLDWQVPFLDQIEGATEAYKKVKSKLDDQIDEANETILETFTNLNKTIYHLNEKLIELEEVRTMVEEAIGNEMDRDDLSDDEKLALEELFSRWCELLPEVPEFPVPQIEDPQNAIETNLEDPLDDTNYPRRP